MAMRVCRHTLHQQLVQGNMQEEETNVYQRVNNQQQQQRSPSKSQVGKFLDMAAAELKSPVDDLSSTLQVFFV